MTKPEKFYIEILTDGSLTNVLPYDKLLLALKKLKPGRWMITLEKYFPQRTHKQMRFYFGNYITAQIECFKQFLGKEFSKEQVHEFNKNTIWGEERLIEETGEFVRIPESSTKQTTVIWEEKLERGREWFRKSFNYELPYPMKQEEIEF